MQHLGAAVLAEVQGDPVLACLLLWQHDRLQVIERLVPHLPLLVPDVKRNARHARVDDKLVLFIVYLLHESANKGWAEVLHHNMWGAQCSVVKCSGV